MNRLRIAICLIPVLSGAIPAGSQTPNFDYPYFIANSDGYIIANNEYTCPAFGDWDDDGDPDLMVGVLYQGNIIFYENISPDTLPQFAAGVLVAADGEPISVNYT